MPVTLEPIGNFGLTPAFWNLPAVTSDGKPIEYFTFSGRWTPYPTRGVEALTEWCLIAVQQLDTPSGSVMLRLIHVNDDDLWDGAGNRYEEVEPTFHEGVSGHLSLTPDQFDSLIAWLRSWTASVPNLPVASYFFEAVDIERLTQMSVPMDPLWTTTVGGQPYRYYRYHSGDEAGSSGALNLVSLSGWTSPNARLSATQGLSFDAYTPEWLARVHDVQARYRDRSEPVPWSQWNLVTGRGQGLLHFTPGALAALSVLLERHRFPQSGP